MTLDRQRLLVLYTVVVLLLLGLLLVRVFVAGASGSPETVATSPSPWLLSILSWLPGRSPIVLLGVVGVGGVFFLFRGWDAVLALPVSAEARFAGFVFAFRFFERDIVQGQGGVLVLACVAAAAVLARRGRAFAGGVCLGVSALILPASLAFLGWVALRRHWRLGAGILTGVAVGFVVGLLPHLAWSGESWLTAWQGPQGAGWWVGAGQGAGSHGVAVPALISKLGLPSTMTWIAGAVGFVSLLWFSWRRRPGFRLGWAGHEVAGACLAGVLFLPGAGEANFVLLWPAAVTTFDAWNRSDQGALRKTGRALWALAFLLVVATSPWWVGGRLAAAATEFFPLVWAGVLLAYLSADPRLFPRGRKAALGGLSPACGGGGS